MLKLPFTGKPKESVEPKFLAVNFNSNSVSCIAFYETGGALKIIGSAKEKLDPGVVRSGVILDLEALTEVLMITIDKACENCEDEVRDVIFGLSGDVSLGLMTTVRAKRDRAVPINKREVSSLFNKISESAIIQAQNEYLQVTGDSYPELETISETPVFCKLDGNNVLELEGKKASIIETAVFSSFSPRYHVKSLQTLAKKAGLKILTLGTELYGISKSIQSSDPQATDYVVLDIGNEFTNAAVVFGKGVVATRVLNVGSIHLIEGVSEKMGLTFREAEKMIKSYIAGQLTQSEGTIVRSCLQEVLEIWLSGVELLFAEYSGVKTFPSKIYLTGAGAEIPELWNMLTTEPWTKAIPFKSPPTYKKITFLELNKISDSTGKASSTEMVSLACLGMIYLEMKGLLP